MGSMGWAAALSVLSAAGYAGAAVAQERLAEFGHRGLLRWAAALLLTAAGVGLHVLALNFGTVAVVQALGTLTLLFALPIWALRYRIRVGVAAWLDAALTVGGLALILSLSVESTEPALLSDLDGRRLCLVAVIAIALLAVAARPAGPRLRAVGLAGAAGISFGIGSVLCKAVMTTAAEHGVSAVSLFQALMVLALSVAGYLLGQLSYRGAGLAAPLATVSVTNPVVAAVAGVVFFDESFRFGGIGQAVVAVAAVGVTLGVIGLSRRTVPPPADASSGAMAARPVGSRARTTR